MRKLLVSLIILTSCGTISSLPSNSSSSFLSIPIANSMFDKSHPEGLLLYEKVLNYEFNSITPSSFEGERLQANNFRRIDGYNPFYSVSNARLSDFSNQQLLFFSEPLKVEDYQSSFSDQNTIQGNSVLSLIDRLARTDDVYNQKNVTSVEKDLSFDVLGDSYFWFNNFVREEAITYTRYTNDMARGISDIRIEYQTEVVVQVDAISQVFSDGALIIELYDETYPIGFFGASDYRTEVVRTQSNFKKALNLGPIHEIYAFNHALSSIQDELPIDNTQSIYSVLATGLSSGRGFDLKIELMIDRFEENTYEKFVLEAKVVEGTWQSFTKMRQMVQLF
jgi:hypothetical protein